VSIIALDVGDKRVGVAVSFSNLQAKPLKVIPRADFDGLLKIIKDFQVSRVVVGEPKNIRGETTSQTLSTRRYVRELISRLKKAKVRVRIVMADERLTSFVAKEELKGQSAKKRKDKIHSFSAQVILESYLNELNREV
jgi:putative Holliday junction resolvase